MMGIVSVHAQTRTIVGRVLSAKDSSVVPNASITYGTNKGVAADDQGNFTLTVSSNIQEVQVGGVNFTTQTVQLARNNLVVYLQPFVQNLDAVVVIGYGTTKKKDLTGSISTVSSKDFQGGTITSPEQLIAGKVPGVSITSPGGQPGSTSTIRIRGGASLNASNDPLVVIDGVPLSSVNLQGINPNDIESFTVLKDAAATAIYGSRASNGVIIVTTKKGKSGKPVITFSTQMSLSKIIKEYPVLTGDQVRKIVDSLGTDAQKAMLGTANTDWQKQIYRTAIMSDNNLSIAGAFHNIPYRISGEYLNQTGIVKTDKLQRGALSINLTPYLFDKHLKIDINLHGATTNSRTSNGGAVGASIAMDPTQSVYSATNKNFGGYFEWLSNDTTPNSLATRNPVALLEQYDQENHALRSFGNVQLDYKFHFLPELHANLNLGYDVAKYKGTYNAPANAAQSYNAIDSLRGQHNQYWNNYRNKVGEFYLNYNKDIASIKSNINAVAGYGYYDNYNYNKNFYGFSASNDTMPNSKPNFPDSYSQVTLISYYGRLIYTYNNKYILMGSIRTDGSSRFAPKYRWGVFPSGAFTWKVGQEDFLKYSNVVSTLNLRLSYGITGNQDGISYSGYMNSYGLSTNQSQVNFGNNYYQFWLPQAYAADLKWEQTATTNVGVDFGFLNNRINASVDYYYKKTSNLLATVFIPAGSNYGNQVMRNVGNMNDQGIDFNINATAIKTSKITWDVAFNVAYNKFTITNLTVGQDSASRATNAQVGGIQGGTGNTIQVYSVGYVPNTFYVLQQVYNSKGQPIEGAYVDQNRDGLINDDDFIHYKSPFAPVTMGFSTSFSYNKWTLSTVLRASIGNYVYNNVASNLAVYRNIANPTNYIQNAPSSVLTTNFYNNQYFSSYYVENASFLKMDNLGISYNVGNILQNSCNLRVSANCQNVFTVTKYSGLDPEIYGGIDQSIYPRPRIFTLGANLSF
ncbi:MULTISPECIES: SusC/RagA family TonB-linked outer membrane protein [Chitinophagaceae]